jgi:hypothetical protein
MRPNGVQLALGFLFFSACAGHTPMPDAFSVDAPGYLMMEPAAGRGDLGRQMERKPGSVSCFGGTVSKPEPLRGWTNRPLKYSGTHALKGDFGDTLKINREAGSDLELSMVLHDVHFEEFQDLYIEPHGACVSDESVRSRYAAKDGRIELVVTRVLKAESIDLGDLRGTELLVGTNNASVGGEVKFESKSILKVGGAHLYFAHFPTRIKVTQRSTSCLVTLGSHEATCQLNTCNVSALKMNKTGTWTGTLNCSDSAPINISRTLGQWDGKHIGPGMTSNIRVTKEPGRGRAKVEMLLWNVQPVDNPTSEKN